MQSIKTVAQSKYSSSVSYCGVLYVEGEVRTNLLIRFTINLLVPKVELEADSLSTKLLCLSPENKNMDKTQACFNFIIWRPTGVERKVS